MTREQQNELEQSINELENDIEPNYTERQEELDWMIERLGGMRKEDFKNFIAAAKHHRKAIALRGKIYAGA